MSVDQLRDALGGLTVEKALASPTDDLVNYLRFLVEPRKAEGKRVAFTLEVEGSDGVYGLELRNGIIAVSRKAVGDVHLKLSKRQLAELVTGKSRFDQLNPALADVEASIVR